MNTKIFLNKIIKFATVGAMSALLDLILLYLFVDIFFFNLNLSLFLAFIFVSIFSFYINKRFSFRDESKNSKTQYLKFVIISGVGLLLTLIIVNSLVFIGLHYILAKVVAIVIVFWWNFSMNLKWTFKKVGVYIK